MHKIFILIHLFLATVIFAQHDHEKPSEKTDTIEIQMTDSIHTGHDTIPTDQDSIRAPHDSAHIMNDMKPHQVKHMSMDGGILLTDVMSKEGSGTSWQPVSSPMHMSMIHSNQWMFMFHGSIVPRFTHQGGLRGNEAFSAPNWFMISAQTKLSKKTQIMFRTMLSLDRLTEGGDGYPLLFQSGETWEGQKLIDRQHPHDFVSELALSFSTKFSNNTGGYIYLGYPGEPAIGPPAFMHRPSAFSNPDAPLSHHWQDATHITFGVTTAGIAYKMFKLEGSTFNGTEPDEDRFNFDKLKLNSYSGRLFFNPTVNISLQVSAGFIKNPEGDSIDIVRRSASILYSKKFGSNSNVSTSIIWGQNKDDQAGAQNSYILEAEYYIMGNSIYTRLEAVQKTRHELGIEIDEFKKELIGAYTVGYKRKLFSFYGMDFNTGAQGTLYTFDKDLTTYYGNSPASYQFYISLTPKMH